MNIKIKQKMRRKRKTQKIIGKHEQLETEEYVFSNQDHDIYWLMKVYLKYQVDLQ